MTSAPEPSTATVTPPAESAPRCAAESTPRARPLTITRPDAARSAASRSATASPYGDAARDPTIATLGALSTPGQPRVHNTGGESAIVVSAMGYAGALHGIVAIDPASARQIASAASERTSAAFPAASRGLYARSRRTTTADGS